jgi:hypothetical protein
VDGYAGQSAGVQLLALISVATLAASVVGQRETSASSDPEFRSHFTLDDRVAP